MINRVLDPRAWIETKYIPEPNSGCWLWLGSLRNGYGGVQIGIGEGPRPRQMPAHRYVWEIYRGKIPAGMHVCHKCDVKCCVNPDHLFLGTASDNMVDMTIKRRHPNPKLTPDQVREIRELQHSMSRTELLRKYGVCRETIRRVIIGKIWRHVQ